MAFSPIKPEPLSVEAAANMGNATPPVKSLPAERDMPIVLEWAAIGAKYGLRCDTRIGCICQKTNVNVYAMHGTPKVSGSHFPAASTSSNHGASIGNMADRDESNGRAGAETPESAAHYIATLAEELARIARRNGLDTLGYILEMARLEADQAVKE
jgi:hypothetical protein